MSDIVERPAPCPFCGGTDIVASNVGEDEDNWFVGCMEKDCGANPGVFCPDSEAAAVAMWNRRSDATITALREEVERLKADAELKDVEIVFLREMHKVKQDKLTALRQRVVEWHAARNATLAEPVADVRKSEAFRDVLNRLSNAEDALAAGARALINEIKEAKDGQ